MVTFREFGARYPLRDWTSQRVSALVMLAYALLLAGVIARVDVLDFRIWRGIFTAPWMRVASLVFFVALCFHAWVGMRNILMDYVKPAGVRRALALAVIFAICIYAGWAASILGRIA